MAAEPLESLHLALMQEVLPVGLAVVDRVRRGGPREVIAAFEGPQSDPLSRLRQEGEAAARQVREGLDQLQPGLGNPVMHVSVRDIPATEAPPPDWQTTTASPAATPSTAGAAAAQATGAEAAASVPGADDRQAAEPQDPLALLQTLERIQQRLDLLEQRLLRSAAQEPTASSGAGRP